MAQKFRSSSGLLQSSQTRENLYKQQLWMRWNSLVLKMHYKVSAVLAWLKQFMLIFHKKDKEINYNAQSLTILIPLFLCKKKQNKKMNYQENDIFVKTLVNSMNSKKG